MFTGTTPLKGPLSLHFNVLGYCTIDILHIIKKTIPYLRMDPKVSEQLSKIQCAMSLFDSYLLVNEMDISALKRKGASISHAVFILKLCFTSISLYSPTLTEKVCILHFLPAASHLRLWIESSVSVFLWAASKTSSFRFLESVPNSARIKFLC